MNYSQFDSFDISLAAATVSTIAFWLLFQSVHLFREIPISAKQLFSMLFVGWLLLVGILSYVMGPEALWLIPGLALCVCLGLAHPGLAASQLIMFFMIRPWEQKLPGEYLDKTAFLLMACSVLSLCIQKIRTRNETFFFGKAGLFYYLLIGWICLCSMFKPSENASFIISNQIIPLLIILFLVIQSITTKKALNVLIHSTAIAVVLVILNSIARSFYNDALTSRLQGIGMWSNSNDLAALAVFAFGVFTATVVTNKSGALLRMLSFLCSLVVLYGIVQTQSRSAFIAVGLICLASGYYLKGRMRILLVAILIILGAVFSFAVSQRSESDRSESEEARFNYAVVGFEMLKSSPIIGVGLGQYPVLFDRYTTVFLEQGLRTAHSSFILVMSETGIIGLFLLLSLVIATIMNAWKIRHEYPELSLSFVGYIVMFSLLSHTYLFLPYLLFLLVQSALVLQNGDYKNIRTTYA